MKKLKFTKNETSVTLYPNNKDHEDKLRWRYVKLRGYKEIKFVETEVIIEQPYPF